MSPKKPRKLFVGGCMKFHVLFFILLIPTLSLSAVELYQVEIKSSVEGGSASRNRLILRDGEFLTYTDKHENTIEVMATDSELGDKKNIEMEFRLSRELEDGSIEDLGTSRLVTSENKTAEIIVEEEGSAKVSISVKAKRI